jgi:integrase
VKGYKRKRGNSWQILVYLGKDANGKKKYRAETFHDEDSAEARLHDLISETIKNRRVPPADMTVAEYLERWLIHYRATSRSAKTVSQAEWACKHIIPALGKVRLSRLTPLEIQTFLDSKQGEFKPKSVKTMRDVLRNALNQAIEWELLYRSPMRGVHLPPLRRVDPPFWSAEQLDKFFDEAKSHRLFAALFLSASTGMRRGEIVGLRWEQVNLGKGEISVRGHTKTESSRRLVNLSPDTVLVLRQYREAQDGERAAMDGYDDKGYVFTSPNRERAGKPIHGDGLYRVFIRISKKANLSHIPFHGLRHTFATLMLQEGVHPKIVSEMLGHAEVRTTLDRYSHLIPSVKKEAANVIDGVLRKVRKNQGSSTEIDRKD